MAVGPGNLRGSDLPFTFTPAAHGHRLPDQKTCLHRPPCQELGDSLVPQNVHYSRKDTEVGLPEKPRKVTEGN